MTQIIANIGQVFSNIHEAFCGDLNSKNEEYASIKDELYSSIETPTIFDDKRNLKSDSSAVLNDLKKAFEEYKNR